MIASRWHKLKNLYLNKLKENYPLSQLTTTQVGGKVKGLITAKTVAELLELIKTLESLKINFLLIGKGSNLLFSDKGFKGIVIKNEVSGIKKLKNNEIEVLSGTLLQDLVDFTIQNGLIGLQKMTGIPGTVGGAIYGNAGAYGQTISDCLKEVKFFDAKIKSSSKKNCQFSYRNSIFKKEKKLILSAKFKLPQGKQQEIEKEAQAIYAKRLLKYPPGIKCPGSFFMNIAVDSVPINKLKLIPKEKIKNKRIHVGWLLESVGAKGFKIGGVKVAGYHGNLFINLNRAKASDYLKLSEILEKRIQNKYGITLTPEVQIIK